jgi:hypothetical protein
VHGLTFRNAGGECMRMRYFAQKNEVSHSRFERCGVYDFRFNAGGKNGEAIYIGTAPEQLGRFGAPDGSVDRSDGNWIHHNTFETQGNECVDIKEGSSGNIVEHNSCTGQRDAESAGLDARGSGNVFRYNTVFGNRGSGVRLGGDGPEDGVLNEVYGNTLRNNGGAAVNAQRGPQGRICENVVSDNALGPTRGKFAEDTDPTASCNTPAGTPARPAALGVASREPPNTGARAEAPPAAAQAPAPSQPGHARVEKKLREMGYTAWKDIQEKGEKYVEIGSARGADGKKYDIKLRASDLSVLRIEPD